MVSELESYMKAIKIVLMIIYFSAMNINARITDYLNFVLPNEKHQKMHLPHHGRAITTEVLEFNNLFPDREVANVGELKFIMRLRHSRELEKDPTLRIMIQKRGVRQGNSVIGVVHELSDSDLIHDEDELVVFLAERDHDYYLSSE